MKEIIFNSCLRILALVKKEILTILMDKNSRVILFAPVIAQCIIFGYGASYHLEHVPYAIYNEARDDLSNEIIQTISNTQRFDLVQNCTSLQELKDSVDSQKSLIGIYIASDFKDTKNIYVALDARNTASANTAVGYVSYIVENINNQIKASPLNINTRFLFNENNYTRYTILIGMTLALSVIQVLLLSSLSVSREKEEGTFDMMIMTPARPFEMLIGKAIPPIIIATIQSLTLIAICVFYFDIPMRGSFIDVMALVIIFACAIVGMGLAISTISKTTMQSLVTAFSLCLILIMASGLITSVDGMPQWFKYVSYCDPLYYGINSMWRIFLQGQTLLDCINLLIPLVLVEIVTLGLAGFLFRHHLD